MTFDAAASQYDRDFTETTIATWLRTIIWQRLAVNYQLGDVVLELGCGTGEDACYLAQQGVHVLATDASAVMLDQTISKAQALGVESLITVQQLDLSNLPNDETRQFDGVFSNFGPLNCTSEWHDLAQWLAARVRSGGVVGFGIMPPFCLWETLWHGLHLDLKTATRRWNGTSIATLADGSTFPIYYPTIHQIKQAFAPWFETVHVRGVGVWLPPSDVYGVIEKHSGLLSVLQHLETRSAHWWPLRNWADHYWIELKRTATSP